MKKADYTLQLVQDLENRAQDCDRNYNAFHEEWERLMSECKTLVEEGHTIMSKVMLDNTESRHATFERMMQFDEEHKAITSAILAIQAK